MVLMFCSLCPLILEFTTLNIGKGGVETVTSWNNMAVCNIDEGRVLILDELKEGRIHEWNV